MHTQTITFACNADANMLRSLASALARAVSPDDRAYTLAHAVAGTLEDRADELDEAAR